MRERRSRRPRAGLRATTCAAATRSRERDAGRTRWQRFFRFLSPPRKLKFTREGKYYLGITLGVGFAAINTGNNLLYLLLGMLLSLIVVSGVMSDPLPAPPHRDPAASRCGRRWAGPTSSRIEVYNHKKRVPSYAIEVEDLRAGQPADKRCFFLKISPSSAQVAAYRRTPARRGRDRHTGFRIATRFPFGLFEKSRRGRGRGRRSSSTPPSIPSASPSDPERRRRERHRQRPRRRRRDLRAPPHARGRRPARHLLAEEHHRRPDHPPRAGAGDAPRRRSRHRRGAPADGRRRPPESEAFTQQFERRVREVASRAVAHIKRGDGVGLSTTLGERARGDKNLGADPILRFLALLDWVDEIRVPAACAPKRPPAPPTASRRSPPSPAPRRRGAARDHGGDRPRGRA